MHNTLNNKIYFIIKRGHFYNEIKKGNNECSRYR